MKFFFRSNHVIFASGKIINLKKTSASLHPIPVKSIVWHQLGIDLIGPLRPTPRGFKYIMTIIDYYSKWAEAGPLKDKTASAVAEFLYMVSEHAWLHF